MSVRFKFSICAIGATQNKRDGTQSVQLRKISYGVWKIS